MQFALHLLAVYALAIIISPMLTGFVYRNLGSALNIGGLPETQFYFSHMLAAAAIPAFLGGYLNSKYRHSSALWVWTVPALILMCSLLTFRSSTVFGHPWSEAFAYYFSPNWSVPKNARDAFSRDLFGMRVFIAQVDVTAPFYAGIGYSLGAYAGIHRIVQRAYRLSHRSN